MKVFVGHIAKAIAVGTLIFLVICGILYYTDDLGTSVNYKRLWNQYVYNMIIAIAIYLANVYTWYFLKERFKNLYESVYRVVSSFLLNMLVSVVAGNVAAAAAAFVLHGTSPISFINKISLFDDNLITALIAFVVLLIVYLFHYYQYRQENKVIEQKIIAKTASAKFDALKNQLDPHFLFNSLNVLTSLIEEDPYQAQKFTTSLSKVYRYVLEQKNKDLISVDEELTFAKTYVRLLKMRFEDSIIFDIPEASASPDAKIVPLSLQLLLENAVKHNIVTSNNPLHIKVYEQNGMLIVENNLQEKQVVKKSTGVGLQNIHQRYEILSHGKMKVEKTKDSFKVLLPLIAKAVTVVEPQEKYLDDKLYAKAKERVGEIKGFYGNLFAYCIVIPFLAYINLKNSPEFLWFFFPAIGWGFGLLGHGFRAFGRNLVLGKGWEDKMVKKYMDDDDF